MRITESLAQMKSGEARWVGRVDIHVYCWAPCDLVEMPSGRTGWQRRVPLYKVWDGEGSPWDKTGWVSAAEAAAAVRKELKKEELT